MDKYDYMLKFIIIELAVCCGALLGLAIRLG